MSTPPPSAPRTPTNPYVFRPVMHDWDDDDYDVRQYTHLQIDGDRRVSSDCSEVDENSHIQIKVDYDYDDSDSEEEAPQDDLNSLGNERKTPISVSSGSDSDGYTSSVEYVDLGSLGSERKRPISVSSGSNSDGYTSSAEDVVFMGYGPDSYDVDLDDLYLDDLQIVRDYELAWRLQQLEDMTSRRRSADNFLAVKATRVQPATKDKPDGEKSPAIKAPVKKPKYGSIEPGGSQFHRRPPDDDEDQDKSSKYTSQNGNFSSRSSFSGSSGGKQSLRISGAASSASKQFSSRSVSITDKIEVPPSPIQTQIRHTL